MYGLIRPFLFQMDAEQAHHFTTGMMTTLSGIPGVGGLFQGAFGYEHSTLEREVFGLTFKNPLGLAAGFDKNGAYITPMSHLGFGFIEVGTVTPRPQAGNPQPRLFRLKQDRAIINRMGFNNDGVDALVNNLKTTKRTDVIIGGNIGKNKDTPNEEAYKDYLICFEKLYDHVDYFVVNLSSPNTPGLRSLQEKEPLQHLLGTLMAAREKHSIKRPVLLKIAPDLTEGQIKDVVDITSELGLDGLIATNTTIAREPLTTATKDVEAIGAGGLSGAPLSAKSTEIIKEIYQQSQGKIPIIGVGGIHDAQTAQDKVDAGATLLQVYSGLIYRGPAMLKEIKKQLVTT